MSLYKKYGSMLIVCILMCLFAGCGLGNGGSSTGTGKPTATPTPTAAQLLQKTQTAMKQLKSAHDNMTMKMQVDAQAKDNNGKSVNVSLGTNTKLDGDVASPKQGSLQMQVEAATGGKTLTYNLSEMMKDNKLYLKKDQAQWYVIDNPSSAVSDALPGGTDNFDLSQTYLDQLQGAKPQDRGVETLDGQPVRHLTVKLDKAALMKLMQTNKQLSGGMSQQSGEDFLKSVTTADGSIDMWINTNNSYLQKIDVEMMMSIDTSQSSASTSSTPVKGTVNMSIVQTLSKFDQPVKIDVPQNATPTNNILEVLGQQQ